MMNNSKTRWHIVYGASDETERFAFRECYAAMSRWLPYTLTCSCADGTCPPPENHHLLFVGTEKSNLHLAELLTKEGKRVSSKPESCLISVGDSNKDGLQTIVICGADTSGVLYGVCDFIHRYAERLRFQDDYRSERFRPFIDGCPAYDYCSSPMLPRRGLWTWGHVIYDYRGYIDNMARLKLNTLIVWNDFPPVNGADIVQYAHGCGVRVLWGFSWGWGVGKIDFAEPDTVSLWRERVISEYEENYAPLGGDGIYFQTDTEFDEGRAGREPIAEKVVGWVNDIAESLLERYPTLHIEFGLHATSVKSHVASIGRVDPRVCITWENLGAFPFSNHANNTDGFNETQIFTKKVLSLRGEKETAGFVFKGFCSLYWPEFESRQGTYLLGEADGETIKKRAAEIRPFLRYEQSGWLKNLDCLQKTALTAAESGKCTGTAALLCEDACFERYLWLPVALFAETLWSPQTPSDEVVEQVTAWDGVTFA